MKKFLLHVLAAVVFIILLLVFYVVSGLESCWYEIGTLLIIGRLMESANRRINDYYQVKK